MKWKEDKGWNRNLSYCYNNVSVSSGDSSDLVGVDWPDGAETNERWPERRGWSEREVVDSSIGGVVLVPINGLLTSSIPL